MKQDKFIKECGPYRVSSISQDEGGVRLVIYPAFPKYEKFPDGESWAIHRVKGDGGGPSIFTAMALATSMENFLNQPYDEESVAQWKAILNKLFGILKRKQKHDRRVANKEHP